jgi:hypothetical protein
MLKPALICAFSGHRPNGTPGRTDAELEATRDHLAQALEILKTRAEAAGGELHFLSGVAAGADIVACETAAGLGIPLHFILPYPEEQFLAEMKRETPLWYDRAERLLASARPGSPLHHAGRTVRVGAVSRHSPDCHAEVNSRTLEIGDFLLTVSTGAPSESIAGTQHLAEQADAHDLPRANVHPTGGALEQAFTSSRLEKFARPDSPGLPIFRQLAHHVTCDSTPGKSLFDATASCLGDAAGHSSKAFRRGTGIAISSHALAGFIAAGAASVYHFMKSGSDHSTAYALFAALAALELLLVGYAFFLEWRNHHSHIQHTWLNCRFAREIMRGIHEASPFLDPLFPHVQSHQQDWHRFATTCALEADRKLPPCQPSHPSDRFPTVE